MKPWSYGVLLLALASGKVAALKAEPSTPVTLHDKDHPVEFLRSKRGNATLKPDVQFLRGQTSKPISGLQQRLLQNNQNDDCPKPAEFFGLDSASPSVSDWLETDDGQQNFLGRLIEIYVNDDLVGAKGEDIRDLDGDFSEVCNRLPLNDTTCYFTQNPDASFLERLVAEFIPFGKQIIAAKDEFDTFMNTVSDTVEEVRNFFLPDAEDVGVCFAINDEMIGIADNPGFPPPLIYEVCNCVSVRSNGIPACTIQPYFRGFAFRLPGANNALVFDVSDRLGDEFFLYDGYIQYKFIARGDVWVSFDLEVKIPKLSKIDTIQNFICAPPKSSGLKKPEFDFPKLTMKTSLFIQNDISNTNAEGELLILAAVEEFRWIAKKFLEISLGTGIAALRIRSENPECQPSGLFISLKLKTDFGLGEGLGKFLKLPNPEANIDFGVTWLDDPEDASDAIQSLFLRLELENYEMMGIQVGKASLEIQYFDDKEFQRRRDFNFTECCKPEFGVSDCSVRNNALDTFIQREGVTAQPTVGLFLDIQDLSWYGIVNFSDIELEFIFQLSFDDFATRFFLFVKCQALFIDLELSVLIEQTQDNFLAAFEASISVDVGTGTVTTTLSARAEVGDFVYVGDGDSRALQAANKDFTDADWDLDFFSAWDTAEWLKDLGKFIVAGLKILYDAIKFVWDKISEVVGIAWTAIQNLAKAIGGAVADLLDGVVDVLEDTSAALSEGIDATVAFLDGQGPVGEFAGEVVEFLGDFAVGVIDTAANVVEVGAAILRGDWSAAGDALADTFGFSKSVSGKTEKKVIPETLDELFGCPLRFLEWEECSRAFGVKYDCKDKKSEQYPERTCAEEKAEMIKELQEDLDDAKQQEDCKNGSKDRSQGLEWAGESPEDEVVDSLGATMAPTNLTIGKTSELGAGACKPVPYTVTVNKLATDSSGTSGKESTSGESSSCVDFASKETLSSTLVGLQESVANDAKDTSRGEQGLDKDPAVKACGDIANATCTPSNPVLTEGEGFQLTANVTCDIDFTNFNFESVFGKADLNMDPSCTPKAPLFKILSSADDPDDGCSPVTMKIERFATDCCKAKTNTFEHTLTIETLPPEFLTTEGSMDTTLDCTENIHPKVLGVPTFKPGCRDALQELDVSDSDPVFDPETCTTTIDRKFSVSDDGCAAKAQTFNQRITLTNDYDPIFDFFPEDLSIGVFDDYGTDATGFPTVFQRCGASPVLITYTDEIKEGDCFAQRVLTRTFTAVDVCGHESVRSQTITIENSADTLPLGDKSLAQIYGKSKVKLLPSAKKKGKKKGGGVSKFPCVIGADVCGIADALADYQCGTADDDEFKQYQTELQNLSTSLNLGTTKTSCACTEGDDTCDESRARENLFDGIKFGVLLTKAAGDCDVVTSMATNTNQGTVELDCSGSQGFLTSSGCTKKLIGADQVYNIFSIEATDLNTNTIEIDAPSTSIILVKLTSTSESDDIKVGKTPQGVILAGDGMVANNVLWNAESAINLKVTPPGQYNFEGTLLNPYGQLKLIANKNFKIRYSGQLFADEVQFNSVDLECAHFAGFASCDNVK